MKTGRYVLLLLIYGWTVALLGYMELQSEVERIGPETVLLTNHFAGDVQECNTAGYGDWRCRPVNIEPRHWIFALIPFWPARGDLAEKLYLSKTWPDEIPFSETPLFSDLIANGAIGIVLLVIGVFIMRIKEDGGSGNADGSSDGADSAAE